MRSGSRCSPAGLQACYHLHLGRIEVIPDLEDSRHGGLHPAGLVNACLGLKVASGLEFQAFVRASRDAGAEMESLFKTSTKPVEGKQSSWSDSGLWFCPIRQPASKAAAALFNIRNKDGRRVTSEAKISRT